MKGEQTLSKTGVRILAQLLALPLDELDTRVKVAILNRLPDEALHAIAQAESEQEALALFTYYGG